MPRPWWRADPQELHRVTDRNSSIYVERCHIDRDENSVVVVNKTQSVRVPAASIAVFLVGPGTRVTHAAMTLLADSGTAVCWVGEQGVRMYAAGMGTSRGSQLLMRQAWLVTRRVERLSVARRMYAMRFPGEETEGLTMQQLRGKEGARVRRLYRFHSERTGVPWSRREYVAGDAFAAGDDVNRVLSAVNSALYGVCHAAITGIGASPGLGFVHTGSALSFVLDIADLYKAEYTIPLAFDLALQGTVDERDARIALRERIAEGKLLPRIVADVKMLLAPEDSEAPNDELSELWDEKEGSVPSGVNWDVWGEALFDEERHVTIVGPELDNGENT